jgi:hypothetical protein
MLSDSARRSRSVWYYAVTSAVAVEPRGGETCAMAASADEDAPIDAGMMQEGKK